MSRVGRKPITIPKGVEAKVEGRTIKIKGPKGQLQRTFHDTTDIVVESGVLTVKAKTKQKLDRQYHGLTRALVNTMIEGVANGYTRTLSLVGVGYRAAMKGKELNLTLGFSHPVVFNPPQGIEIKVDKQTTIVVTGPDKAVVGQVAADIRGFRPPEPYHGKGVRYADEVIKTKVGKAGGKT